MKRQMGTNVEIEIDDEGIATLRIDLNRTYGASASGKTLRVATTEGNHEVDNARYPGVVLGLNCYKKP